MPTDDLSGLPPGCPEFEYGNHPNRALLTCRVEALLLALEREPRAAESLARDTRPAHRQLFEGLTPPLQPYYAGHYRGEAFYCLRDYAVSVAGDPRVGARPGDVAFLMEQLALAVSGAFDALDTAVLTPTDQLRYLLRFACTAFVQFLTTHPYANGNGHAGRLLIWCILGRYGHWPVRWSVEPRPRDPPYTDFIRRYRDGDREPLELFVASMLARV